MLDGLVPELRRMALTLLSCADDPAALSAHLLAPPPVNAVTGGGRRFTEAELLEEEARNRKELSFLGDTEAVVRLLPATQYTMADLSPVEWVRTARFLHALITREPIASSPWHEPTRLLVGALVTELYQEARARGEPMPELTKDELLEHHARLDRMLAARPRRGGDR